MRLHSGHQLSSGETCEDSAWDGLNMLIFRIRGGRRNLGLVILTLFLGSIMYLDVYQKKSELSHTSVKKRQLVFSSNLKSRLPWEKDDECSQYKISHLVPKSSPACALASYPGSGNTWLRYLIEGATGVFTGSRYKDLQIQMYGLWGEIRDWQDGTTIVQKTHDSHPNHVKNDFEGRGILILRNPYDAVLSDHNFLFGGHMGVGPASSYDRKDWESFVTIETSAWLGMAVNWTRSSEPDKLLVVHYEEVKTDLESQMRKILQFLGVEVDQKRLSCLSKHRNGFFHRKFNEKPEKLPFSAPLRNQMDHLIENLNTFLIRRGYTPLPLALYNFYRKSDQEIIADLKSENLEIRKKKNEAQENTDLDDINPNIGTKMVVDNYFRWLSEDHSERGLKSSDDIKTFLMRKVYGGIKKYSNQNTITGLSERAEKILSYAVEMWPSIQKPFQKDPISEVVETKSGNMASIQNMADEIQSL